MNKADSETGKRSNVTAGYGDYRPSKLSWHEALDRSSLACDFFSENVEQHQAVQNDVGLKIEAEKLTMAMADFYQKVGHKSYEFDQLENEP